MTESPFHVAFAAVMVESIDGSHIRTVSHASHTLIYTSAATDPIVVTDDDVILPDAISSWASGISLDLAAFRAERADVSVTSVVHAVITIEHTLAQDPGAMIADSLEEISPNVHAHFTSSERVDLSIA